LMTSGMGYIENVSTDFAVSGILTVNVGL